MTKLPHVLELNGRQYDALTGKLLATQARSVDGFWQPAAASPATRPASHTATPERPSASEVRPAVAKPGVMDISRPPARRAVPHQTQHSQTLVRSAVKHPAGAALKRHVAVAAHTGTAVPAIAAPVAPKRSAQSLDIQRLRRAQKASHSELVQHFAAPATPAPRPTATMYQHRAVQAPQPRPAPPLSGTPAPTISEDVFERALAVTVEPKRPRAYSAGQKPSKGRRLRRFATVFVSIIAVLSIAGFVAYQNVTGIQLRLASARAGLNATVPSWQPSGYHLAGFTSGHDTLTVTYQDEDSGQHYSITQTASSWDSATLLSDFVYPKASTYDTITAGGTTIYTYATNNATWVSGGMWYKMATDGGLSTSQIVNIATSMQS